jgi:hypothetical protein
MIKTKASLSGEEDSDEEEEEEDQQALSHQNSSFYSIASSSPSSAAAGDNTALSHQSSFASASAASATGRRPKAKEKPLYQLGDFWFFHNPRKVGCPFSEGRADWGNRRTAPPEAEGGFKITEKSDIWALGVCIYSWCTRGLPLPLFDAGGGGGGDAFSSLMNSIPLKWGPWVNSLIKMCLQRNPKFRASSADVYQFLVLTSAKK